MEREKKIIHYNTAFKDMPAKDVNLWVKLNYNKLIGSAIFTQNSSLTSKIVRWAENWGKKDKNKFTPSHTGSLIEYNNQIYLFDMKPPRAKLTPLVDYILNTKDDYAIVLRDFNIDGRMFSINILEHVGEFYPFLSAIRSVFTKRQSKWRTHCSELHLREIQKQGILLGLNPEITPDELYHEMIS